MRLTYDIAELMPYINWAYFYFAWGIHNKDVQEKLKLRTEAETLLQRLNGRYSVYALFELFDACSEGDDVYLYHSGQHCCSIPFLRQQQPDSDFLCLADFIRPQSFGTPDKIGIFATSVSHGLETDFSSDGYQKMMAQLLADRLAEAAAERMHEAVRKEYWGYAAGEKLSVEDLHAERFQGIRPAVGYPSLPDTSINFLIDDLLCLKQIGIRLTESGAMSPHASVSGFMLAHPHARYFSVGRIGEDQLADYARRRGLPLEVCRRFLSCNLQ